MVKANFIQLLVVVVLVVFNKNEMPRLSQSFAAEGFFIYTECDNVFNGGSAGLKSPSLSSKATQICVQFRYYMYGSDSENVLRILAKRPGGGEDEIWTKTGFQSPSWLKGEVTVTKPSTDNVVVSIYFLFFLLSEYRMLFANQKNYI